MLFLNFCILLLPKPKPKPPINLNNSYPDSSPDGGFPAPILKPQRKQKGPDPQGPPQSDAPLPHLPEAITDFSQHKFFTATNFIRLMQKMGFERGGSQGER
ncbi:hypothetical protein B9Z19DRAFT_1065614 [Tuber borchii]|uniref:Far11/STRP C-terminal domain-containing protein n=1 Tax=Tuber borchii TaxID=42251 RepID=A0A2T6ZQE4_TUBBO|nr:hypothetical protein B9Z19DRAFT_1065614 [Tuber borchii]